LASAALLLAHTLATLGDALGLNQTGQQLLPATIAEERSRTTPFGAFAMSGFPPPKNQYGTGYGSESNDPLSVPTSWASLCKLKLKQMPSDRVHSPRQSRRGEAAMTATVQNTTALTVAMAVVLAIILSPLLGW
jgi:hypothetical protein